MLLGHTDHLAPDNILPCECCDLKGQEGEGKTNQEKMCHRRLRASAWLVSRASLDTERQTLGMKNCPFVMEKNEKAKS